MNPPSMIAGACGYGSWPPNSLEGARRCVAHGLDGIEIDVHLSADGQVVLHHDYRLDPDQTRLNGEWLAKPTPLLKTMSLAQLRRYDLGRSRPGSMAQARHSAREEMDNVRIATLRDVLRVLKETGRNPEIYVEIKTSPQDAEESSDPLALTRAVVAELETASYLEFSRIIAFDWSVLRETRLRAPGLKTSHLTIPPPLQHQVKCDANGDSPWADGCDPRHHDDSLLRAIAAHGGTCWSAHFLDITPQRASEARELGLEVAAWGLSTASEIDKTAALGAGSLTVSGPVWRVGAKAGAR